MCELFYDASHFLLGKNPKTSKEDQQWDVASGWLNHLAWLTGDFTKDSLSSKESLASSHPKQGLSSLVCFCGSEDKSQDLSKEVAALVVDIKPGLWLVLPSSRS